MSTDHVAIRLSAGLEECLPVIVFTHLGVLASFLFMLIAHVCFDVVVTERGRPCLNACRNYPFEADILLAPECDAKSTPYSIDGR